MVCNDLLCWQLCLRDVKVSGEADARAQASGQHVTRASALFLSLGMRLSVDVQLYYSLLKTVMLMYGPVIILSVNMLYRSVGKEEAPKIL